MSRKTVKGSKVGKKVEFKLSSGLDSNLENWREVARLAFGDQSCAVAFIDEEIEKAEHGDQEVVMTSEADMTLILSVVEDHKLVKPKTAS